MIIAYMFFIIDCCKQKDLYGTWIVVRQCMTILFTFLMVWWRLMLPIERLNNVKGPYLCSCLRLRNFLSYCCLVDVTRMAHPYKCFKHGLSRDTL